MSGSLGVVNADVPHPRPNGAPFFFGASFTPESMTAVVIYLGGTYHKTVDVSDRDLSTANVRIGRGNATAFTNSPFLACSAGFWDRAFGLSDFKAVYDWCKHQHARVGLQY